MLAPVVGGGGGCKTAIGGQEQSGCMWPVCRRSLSKLPISVCTMLKDAATLPYPGWAWSCLEGTVVGWLVPMVRLWVRARVRAEWCYRLLSCPGSAASGAATVAAVVEQLGAALAAEQLVQPQQKEQLDSPLQQQQQQQQRAAAIAAAEQQQQQ